MSRTVDRSARRARKIRLRGVLKARANKFRSAQAPAAAPARTLVHEAAHERDEAALVMPGSSHFHFLGSCVCPLPGPCSCGSVLE